MASRKIIVLFCLLAACSSLAEGARQIGKDYSFSYSGDSSARDEAADDQGTVEGSYTYIDEDGIERTVRYVASEGTGFVAEGDGIVNVAQLIEDTRARRGPYEPSPEELASWANADRSYSLSYHAGDSFRSEVSRPDGYVTGTYSYLDRDGVERIVEYEAGPGIGFRVKGDHIHPKIASDSVPSDYQLPNLQLSEYTTRAGLVEAEPSNIRKVFNSDGSITYSYEARDHSRTETVYPNGEVVGSYTYITETGETRTVEYVGGSGVGFLASGDHLSSSIGSLSASAVGSLTSNRVRGSGVGSIGGSTVETTRTETLTGGRRPILSSGLSGTVGSTVTTTTDTQPLRGSAGGPIFLPSIVDEEDNNRQVVITTTTTTDNTGVGGSAGGLLNNLGGHRIVSTGQSTSQLQNLLSGNQGNLVFRPSGSRYTTGSTGGQKVVKTTTRKEILRPVVLTSTTDLGGTRLNGGNRQQSHTTIKKTVLQGPLIGPSSQSLQQLGQAGRRYINFSTQDGKQHQFNLDRLRNLQ